jgi:hypothetical protein
MKKFFTVALLVLSMLFFVACGDDDDDINTQGLGGGNGTGTNTGTDENNEDNKGDSGKTDTGDTGENTGDDADSTDDTDSTGDDDTGSDDADTTDETDSTGDETDSGNDEPIDDSNCETVVYKSMDMILYDVNEIDIWIYDTETYDDYTDPLFFIQAYFAKNVDELKGETVSLKGSDPNKEDGTRVFFYTDFDASMSWFKKNYIAKSGSFHIEDVDADDYTKLKIDTTAIVFYELAIDEENGVYTEPANGKCYKLAAFEWNSID